MKRIITILLTSAVLVSCGGGDKKETKSADELAKLKKERAALDEKIRGLESNVVDTSKKATPVTVAAVQPVDFTSYVAVQSQISGDENVLASPQMGGTVREILVHVGQRVGKGQVLATLDAASVDQQIAAAEITLNLAKTTYEKYQRLWAQNIGTEIQLLNYKANYENALKQKAGLVATRNTFKILSPISGTVDEVSLKVGDAAQPGGGANQAGIRVVSTDKLKAEASLGENYLGKVKQGDPVILVFSDINDSIRTNLTYVGQAVNVLSRTFPVQVRLGSNSKLHPNMSCQMKIANYHKQNALTVPVATIQKTAQGEVVYIADGKTAKAVIIQTGRNSNGMVEVLSGLSAGDLLITEGYQELDNGTPINPAQ